MEFARLKFTYISGTNFPSSENENNPLLKCFLRFKETELSTHKLKNLLFWEKHLRFFITVFRVFLKHFNYCF